MALWTFLGLVGAVVYILITPPAYEATAQIRMAQVSVVSPANPFGANVEDPASLISRMQFPTNYSDSVIATCGYQDKPLAAVALAKSVRLSVLKGVANTVELKVLGTSPKVAESCAEAIFRQIALMQEQLSKVFVEEAKLKLAADNERIEGARQLIAKADKSGSAMSAAYLSARDELTYFLTDREKMLDLINSVKSRGSRLDSPIFVSDRPVSPRKAVNLLAGVIAGLVSGIMVALGRQVFRRFKGNKRVVL